MRRTSAAARNTASQRLRAWWLALPAALRAPWWPSALAALIILALLIGFHSVVRGAVKQGELLRMNTATRAEAVWRCNALSGARMRATCLAQIDAPPSEQPDGEAPPNTAAERLAGIGG
ncbi:MAG: hypothetical protein ACJ8G7_24140, partial [Rhizobacter sp.]